MRLITHIAEAEWRKKYLGLVGLMGIRCCRRSIRSLGSVERVRRMAMTVLVGSAVELRTMLFQSEREREKFIIFIKLAEFKLVACKRLGTWRNFVCVCVGNEKRLTAWLARAGKAIISGSAIAAGETVAARCAISESAT